MKIKLTSKTVLLILLTMLFSYGSMVVSCKAEQPASPAKIFKSISPQEANLLLQKRNDDILFLDVRTPRERANGAIAGSELVSIWDIMKGRLTLPKNKAILLVCAVGGRSYMAGQILSQRGYPEVYNLSGGINAWYKQGLPIM